MVLMYSLSTDVPTVKLETCDFVGNENVRGAM